MDELEQNEFLFTVFDACRCGYIEFVTDILNEDETALNLLNDIGENCLMICSKFNQIEILKYILSFKNINYSFCHPYEHHTALHHALKFCNFRIAQQLLKKHSFPKYQLDGNGYDAFDFLPSKLYKKQLFDDIYNRQNERFQEQIREASFTYMLQDGECQRIYGDFVSNLRVQGVCYSYGFNKNGQLALENNGNHRATPKIIGSLRNISIKSIACSGYHSIAISDDGNAYSWGNNEDGRCGLGHISNDYKAYIQRPTKLKIKSQEKVHFIDCTASLDVSALLTANGKVYAFGVDKNSKIVKYTKKSMKLIWKNELKPFCVTNNSKHCMQFIASCFERICMVGSNDNLYLLGRTFNNAKANEPMLMSTSNRIIKKVGIESVCVGDSFLVVLLLNGVLLSRNKNKNEKGKKKSATSEFSEIRLNKYFNFRHYHNKRETVRAQQISCYESRCVAVATNGDIFEWKGGCTDAYCVGNVEGVTDISVGPKLVIMCNTMGEVFAYGMQQLIGLSSKDRKLMNVNRQNQKNLQRGGKKMAKIERVITLSQIGRVFASKDSVFVIQSFFWPDRNMLNAHNHHRQMKELRNKRLEKKFWNNEDFDDEEKNNQDLFDYSNMFDVLALDETKENEESDDDNEEKINHHRSTKNKKKSKNKRHKKQNKKMKKQNKKRRNVNKNEKATKQNEKRNDDEDFGLDDENVIGGVPSLVAYCEDLLIHQIDIQTVISLYIQSYSMGFHRISVFLSFVIIENMEHLLYFLLRDCTEEQVAFVEQLYKSKYYPQTNMSHADYYGNCQYFEDRKKMIEQYRILPASYPNYKSQKIKIQQKLDKIQRIEEKVEKLMIECKEKMNNEDDDEVIYFDSEESDEEPSDSAFVRALSHLSVKERHLFESKQQTLADRNLVFVKISNPAMFPCSQMMDKWKRNQKKPKRKRKKRAKHVSQQTSESDKYLRHVCLRESDPLSLTDLGYSFGFDYDLYCVGETSKAVIYREFDVEEAIKTDAKKARKIMKKKQKKIEMNKESKTSLSNKEAKKSHEQNSTKNKNGKNEEKQPNQSGAARKRRNRKKKSQMLQAQAPKIRPVANKKSNVNMDKQKRDTKRHLLPKNNDVLKTKQGLSPMDVVRRNRNKKIIEEQVSHFTNDVWELTETNENNTKTNGKLSLDNIQNSQKNKYFKEKRQEKDERYREQIEAQCAWSQSQSKSPTQSVKGKLSVIDLAQEEELQFRSLVQHEHEWMIGSSKNDDYDAFIKQQQLLLQSFQHKQENSEASQNDEYSGTHYRRQGHEYTRGRHYYGHRGSGNRGGGRGYYNGYNRRNDAYHNYNHRGRGRGFERGQFNNYNSRGRGEHTHNNGNYTDSNKSRWRKKQ